MSSQTIRLVNEIAVGERPTHIVIYQEMKQEDKLTELIALVEKLTQRVTTLELELARREVKPSPYFSAAISPEPAGLEVNRPSDTKTIFNTLVASSSVPKLPELPSVGPLSLDAEEVENLDDAFNAVEENFQTEAEEAEEEEGQADEEEAEEGEGEADGDEDDNPLRLKSFEFKGKTYYRDQDNLVYIMDGEDDLDDTPIGIWSDDHDKILYEFEYKEATYYRDDENQVYALDAEGSIQEKPYGLWSVEKNKVLRYK